MIGKDIPYLIFNTWYYWTILTAHRQYISFTLFLHIRTVRCQGILSERTRVERYKDMTQYNHNTHFSS